MTEPRPQMTSEDATMLYTLRRIWEGIYKIDRDSDGLWRASRLVLQSRFHVESSLMCGE
jgi:hypothetical protein